LCDNHADRARQIAAIVEAGHLLQSALRTPFAHGALRLARLPARMIGWGELHDFLERGFDAWSPVRDHERFLHIIESRERALLDRIYLTAADPGPNRGRTDA
jgi:hypothetical protein